MDTVQQAVDKLKGKGGVVHICEGLHYSGPVTLSSGVHLYLEKQAELRFVDDFSLYPSVYTRWEGIGCFALQSLIFAENASDITISGEGTLNGLGRKWWDAYKGIRDGNISPEAEEVRDRLLPLNVDVKGGSGGGGRETGFLRPSLIQFKNCSNISITGVTVENSPFWNTHILCCDTVIIRNVQFRNPTDAPNTDGLDIDSSENVLVEYCRFDVGDDCLCLKAGMDVREGKENGETSDIRIRNCSMNNGHGAVVFGSETSGGIRNVDISDCTMNGTDRGIRVKTRRGRGGFVEDITIRNIRMEHVAAPLVFNMYYRCGAEANEIPVLADRKARSFDQNTTPLIRNILIEDVTASDISSSAAFFSGLPESPISGVKIRNCRVSAQKGCSWSEPAMDFSRTSPRGPELLSTHITNSDLTGITINNESGNTAPERFIQEEKEC